MDQYDRLYRLYETVDTDTLRAYQEVVDLFPPLSSTVGLDQWERAKTELDDRKADVVEAFPDAGEDYAELAANLSRDEAFTALDLYTKYDRTVNVLILDVDETLRSAGDTDNEIPRQTLHSLTEFHERGVPIVVCTGQTLENVKGFMIQGLGNDVVSSGSLSVVYETGNAVFTPGQGADTKRLLYEELDPVVVETFDAIGEAGLDIVIVSNLTTRIQLKKIEHLGIEGSVDLVVTSEEAGSEKPASVMFTLPLSQLDLRPSEVVMVGDSVTADIEGGNAVGLTTVLFNSDEAELESRRQPDHHVDDFGDIAAVVAA